MIARASPVESRTSKRVWASASIAAPEALGRGDDAAEAARDWRTKQGPRHGCDNPVLRGYVRILFAQSSSSMLASGHFSAADGSEFIVLLRCACPLIKTSTRTIALRRQRASMGCSHRKLQPVAELDDQSHRGIRKLIGLAVSRVSGFGFLGSFFCKRTVGQQEVRNGFLGLYAESCGGRSPWRVNIMDFK
jgi:hypothetical protein